MPDLRTIRDVELVKVGTWQVSTGEWQVSTDDLKAAIAAHKAGVLRKAVLKIGHEDPRFDGGPALGYIDNLRLTDSGNTLVGDLVNVPSAVAKLLPHAYPDRSVEAVRDYTGPDGTAYPLVLTAVALLGATAPGIDSLASLQDAYGVAAKRVTIPSPASTSGRPRVIAATARLDGRDRAVRVAAARRRRTQRLTMKG